MAGGNRKGEGKYGFVVKALDCDSVALDSIPGFTPDFQWDLEQIAVP